MLPHEISTFYRRMLLYKYVRITKTERVGNTMLINMIVITEDVIKSRQNFAAQGAYPT